MSARWRRNRKTEKKFNIFKVFNKNKEKAREREREKEKNVPRTFQVKGLKIKPNHRNIKYNVEKISEHDMKEPPRLIDVVEEEDQIAVFAEFAGFKKEDLKINVKDQRLTLSAKSLEHRIHKSLNLPKRVIPETICTTYKNGVLEIRLKKIVENQAYDRIVG